MLAGIDIGASSIKAASFDEDWSRVREERCPTPTQGNPQALVSVLAELVSRVCGGATPATLGVGIPGELDAQGRIIRFPNIQGCNGADLTGMLHHQIPGLAIAIDNDANCAALAEWRFGALQPYRDLLHVTLGTGVGGGLILRDELFRGRNGFAGEIGHILVDSTPEARRCGCGAQGCIEAYAGSGGIEQSLAEAGIRGASLKDAAELARHGDPLALDVFRRTGAMLGSALASLLNILNLEAIAFSGGLSGALDLMLPEIACTLRDRCMGKACAELPLLKSSLGEHAGVLGAALLGASRLNTGS